MLHQLELVGTAILTVLGAALCIFVIWRGTDTLLYTPTARDQEGAKEAMEEYSKRQRERLKADKDEATNGAHGPERN